MIDPEDTFSNTTWVEHISLEFVAKFYELGKVSPDHLFRFFFVSFAQLPHLFPFKNNYRTERLYPKFKRTIKQLRSMSHSLVRFRGLRAVISRHLVPTDKSNKFVFQNNACLLFCF